MEAQRRRGVPANVQRSRRAVAINAATVHLQCVRRRVAVSGRMHAAHLYAASGSAVSRGTRHVLKENPCVSHTVRCLPRRVGARNDLNWGRICRWQAHVAAAQSELEHEYKYVRIMRRCPCRPEHV
jgi:hypothetical protein